MVSSPQSITLNDKYCAVMQQCAVYLLALSMFCMSISVTVRDIGYFLGVFVALLGSTQRGYWQEIFRNPISYWLLAFFSIFIIGISYSIGSWQHISHDIHRHMWILLTLFLIPLFTKKKYQSIPINALLVGMVVVCLFSYLGYFGLIKPNTGIGHLLKMKLYDNTSVFISHINQNFLMALAANIFLCKIYYQPSRYRWFYVLIFLLMTYNVFFISLGRTGYVAYAAIFIALSYYRFGLKKCYLSILFIISLLTLALAFPTGLKHRIKESKKSYHLYQSGVTQTSDGLRIAMFMNNLRLIKERPIFGYGTGSYGAAYQSLPNADIKKTGVLKYSSEITYMNLLVEFGIIGLLIFSGLIIALFKYTARLDAQTKIVFHCFLVAFLTGACFTAFLYTSFARSLFSIMIAISAAGVRRKDVTFARQAAYTEPHNKDTETHHAPL